MLRRQRKKGSDEGSSTPVKLKHWLGLVGTGSTCGATNVCLKAANRGTLFSPWEKLRGMLLFSVTRAGMENESSERERKSDESLA